MIRALWGEDPPASARKTLQTYVSNLRHALGWDSIATHPSGYVLEVDAEDGVAGNDTADGGGGVDTAQSDPSDTVIRI